MAFRSPGEEFAPYFVRAGEALAGFFRQREEDRKADKALLDQTKLQFAQNIEIQLANQFLPEAQRRQLNEQLQMVNMAETQDQLLSMFYGTPESTTVVPGEPMQPLPGGGRALGAPEVTVTTGEQLGLGRTLAEARSASSRAERAYNSTQNQLNFIQQLASEPDIAEDQRQALARRFLGGINPDLLEEGQMNTLLAATGYVDEPALRTAINNANLSGSQATQAAVAADIAVNSYDQALSAVLAEAGRTVLAFETETALAPSVVTQGQSAARRAVLDERRAEFDLGVAEELRESVIAEGIANAEQARIATQIAQRTMDDVISQVAAGSLQAQSAAEVASQTIDAAIRQEFAGAANAEAIARFAAETLQPRIDAVFIDADRAALALDIGTATRDATIAQANATASQAETVARITQETASATIQQAIAQGLSAEAAAELAARTVDAEVRRALAGAANAEAIASVATQTIESEVSAAVARATSAESQARVQLGTEQTQIDLLAQQYRINEDTLARAAETHAQNLELTGVQIADLRRRMEQSNILFERELSDDDLNRVQAALDTGVDAFLTADQRRAAAASLGYDVETPEGLRNYNETMRVRRDLTRSAGEAQLIAAALADDQALLNLEQGQVSIEQTRQSIANAKQQFEVTAYNFGRSRRLDPLRDSAAFASALNDDVFAGNTAVFDQYINILSNPDLYFQEAQGLRELGYTVEMLRNMRGVAEAERAKIITDSQARSDLLAGQVLQLSRANQVGRAAIIADVASYYPTVEALDADVARLQDLRFEPGEIDAIRAQVRLRNVLPPADRLTALTRTPPDPDAYADWRTTFVSLAGQVGFTDMEASVLADGFVNAFESDNSAAETQRRIDELNENRLRLQVQALENPVPEDHPLALSITEQLSALTNQRLTTQQLQVTNSCLPSSSLAEFSVRQIEPADPNVCRNLESTLENLQIRLSQLTGVYYQATGETLDPSPDGDVSTFGGGAAAPPARAMQFGDVTVPAADVERLQGIVSMSEEQQERVLADLQGKYGVDITRQLLENALRAPQPAAVEPETEEPLFPSLAPEDVRSGGR